MRPTEAAALMSLILLSVGLALYFFTGFYGFDDAQYSSPLREIRDGRPLSQSLGAGRWLISIPYLLYAYILNIDGNTAVSLHSIQYILLVFSVLILTRMIATFWAAIGAAFLVATTPLVLVYSGSLFPDNLLSMLIVWEFGAVLMALRTTEERRVLAWAALAGFLHALQFTIKEPSIVFVLFTPILVIILLGRAPRLGVKAALAMGFAFCLGLAVDMAVNFSIFGNPIVRWMTIVDPYVADYARRVMAAQGTYPLDRIIRSGGGVSQYWSAAGIGFGAAFVWISILCPLILIVPAFRRYHFVMLCLTLSATVIYHVLGSVSLREYIGIWLTPRYLAPAAVMISILAALLADATVAMIPRQGLRIAAGSAAGGIAMLAGANFVVDAAKWANQIDGAEIFDETVAAPLILRAVYPNVPIYAGPLLTHRILRFGAIPDLQSFDEVDRAARKSDAHFFLLMERTEKISEKNGFVFGDVVSINRRPQDENPLWKWRDRLSELKTLLGFGDPSMLVPFQRIHLYEVRPKSMKQDPNITPRPAPP